MKSKGPFGDWAARYRALGYWPRPLKYPGTDKNGKPLGKGCYEIGWTTPDIELPPSMLKRWEDECGHYNIGVLLGNPLADGTYLGALDIDHDAYVGLGKALFCNPPCMRFGAKGVVIFLRYTEAIKKRSKKFSPSGPAGKRYGQAAELLLDGQQVVIPPSIHPDTNQEYRWIGTPLHEIDPAKLPLLGE